MHELSIARDLIELADEAAAGAGAERVLGLRLRLGALSGVAREALEFCFEVAAAGTRLEGARLEVEEVAAAVYCPRCARVFVLPSIQEFRCPACGAPTPDVRAGKELELASLELPADEDGRGEGRPGPGASQR